MSTIRWTVLRRHRKIRLLKVCVKHVVKRHSQNPICEQKQNTRIVQWCSWNPICQDTSYDDTYELQYVRRRIVQLYSWKQACQTQIVNSLKLTLVKSNIWTNKHVVKWNLPAPICEQLCRNMRLLTSNSVKHVSHKYHYEGWYEKQHNTLSKTRMSISDRWNTHRR